MRKPSADGAAVCVPEAMEDAADVSLPETEAGEIIRARMLRRMRDWRLGVVDLLLLCGMLMQLGVARTLHRLGWDFHAAMQQMVAIGDLLLVFACLITWAPILWISGIYRQYSSARVVQRGVLAAFLMTGSLAASCLLFRPETALHAVLPLFFFSSLVVLFAARTGIIIWSRTGLRELSKKRLVLLVGSGPLAERLAWRLQRHESIQYQILGYVDSGLRPIGGPSRLGQRLCGMDGLEEYLLKNVVDEVHIALPVKSHYEEIQHAVQLCELSGIDPHYPADLFQTHVAKGMQQLDGRVVFRMTHSDSRLVLKRSMDIVVSAIGLVALSPLLLVIAILIKCTSRGPVFFLQPRFGLNKRTFKMVKFRSMVDDAEKKLADIEHMNEADGPIFKIARDPRITWIGAFLRKSSLDELPQLWNVLCGQMSLVGPRPMSIRDVTLFDELALMRRFSVPPGITGLWQVSGRSSITFDQWIQLDLQYIDNWSLKLDLSILLRTLPAVLWGKGAS